MPIVGKLPFHVGKQRNPDHRSAQNKKRQKSRKKVMYLITNDIDTEKFSTATKQRSY
jgi:hypothetical protein